MLCLCKEKYSQGVWHEHQCRQRLKGNHWSIVGSISLTQQKSTKQGNILNTSLDFYTGHQQDKVTVLSHHMLVK